MRVFFNILLISALLQGCTPVVRKAPDPVDVEPDNSRLLEERQQQAHQHRQRALEYEQQQDFLNAAQERLNYHLYLDESAAIKANSAKIWENLNRADKDTLRRRYLSDPRALSGWLELAFIKRTMLADLQTLEQALASWQQNYPAHPAGFTIVGQIRETARLYNRRPRKIALLLPLRGAFREAAEAVRDGFMAAWYRSGQYQPPLRVYEANALNIEQAYAQAVAEGADFIVGPLEKQAMTKLSTARDLSVPALGLNQVRTAPETARRKRSEILPALMQFSLSPEDEARQVAARAAADGYRRALVIVPDDTWGRRLARVFRESWAQTGGVTLETITYDPSVKDYATPVKQMLNIDSSESRIQALRQLLGRKLEYQTRRRQDADMIFMVAFPIDGRQIVPQLRFLEAGQVPVYATSHIFTGNVNPQADADMDGVAFLDLPWILSPTAQTSSLKALVDDNFQAASSAYQRLYAFGADAFNLIPHLPRLAYEGEASFAGATGLLSMSANGRINRKLPWGKIINGKPESLVGR